MVRHMCDVEPDPELLPDAIRQDRQIVFDGKEVNTVITRPRGTEDEILPVIVFIHGGGWTFNGKFTHRRLTTEIAIRSHAAIVHVLYSLSPEVQFPVAIEECFSVVRWLHEHGKDIQVAPERLVVAGDSAGGNMATGLTLMAKERGFINLIKAQVMLYPPTAADFTPHKSIVEYGQGDYYINIKDIQFFADAYCLVSPIELNNKLATPLLSTLNDLEGLPPALLITAEYDMLRDEGEEYGRKMMQAGVDIFSVRVHGTIHGFMHIPGADQAPQYNRTLNLIVGFLLDILKRPA
ncbi:hypothetical protein DFQ30_006123 [Apophysomyces sp. BC1015]|nr:hypothetical protein DFQ30_006123 [Apophysomyces sp. BC1015]